MGQLGRGRIHLRTAQVNLGIKQENIKVKKSMLFKICQ